MIRSGVVTSGWFHILLLQNTAAEILSDIASYGRQIGRLQVVMAVLIDPLEKNETLAGKDRDAVQDFRSLMREIEKVKARHS